MNNNLVNKFQSYKNNTPFNNNPLLNNNPVFMSNSRDSSFYNKINMAKMEQIKRAKNIDDMGMDKKQITDLIICPIVVNKTKKTELDEAFNEITPQYRKDNNKFLQEWWNTRTNQPYKNIIKKDLFNKDFKKYYKDDIFNTNIKDKKDLRIHTVTDIDSDSLLLEAEFELLSDIIEKHNKELKVIYSASNKNKYKKEFEYVQNYRYRLEYNPKNSEELKDFYKKEQSKINKEKKMIDDVINMMIENDQLDPEEIEKLNKEISSNKKLNKIENLEDELRKELGDDFENIIDNIDIDNIDIDNIDIDNIDENILSEIILDKSEKKIRITSTKTTNDDELPKKKITVKTIKNEDNDDKKQGTVSDDIRNKYKNRKQ
jgi:Tfp pilus assembly major pilin PilA